MRATVQHCRLSEINDLRKGSRMAITMKVYLTDHYSTIHLLGIPSQFCARIFFRYKEENRQYMPMLSG